MIRRSFVILLTLIAFCCQGMSAQNEDAATKRRVQEVVAQLGDYLNYMADKNNSLKSRQYYRKKALKLFIGNGEPYTIGSRHFPAVSMQTTSLRNRTPKTQPMAEYFTHLINLRYEQVSLETTEVAQIKVSDLRKIDDDTYVCTANFEQWFVGKRREGGYYKDKTNKSVQVYVKVEDTIDNPEYIILLGNITATHTERLQ